MNDTSQMQRYCRNCGGQIRSSDAFCAHCGEPTASSPARGRVRPASSRLNASSYIPLNLTTPQLVALGFASIFFLVVTYLLLSYSIVLGVLVIGSLALLVLWIRKNQGKQTDFERQVFREAGNYGHYAQRAYTKVNTKYQTWLQETAAERERNAAYQQVEAQRNERRKELDQYRRFFERAYDGSQTSLDWWQAYQDKDDNDQLMVTNLLKSARDRAEAGLDKVRELESSLPDLLQQDLLGDADGLLEAMRKAQEDVQGDNSVFSPLVEVHNRIKGLDEWESYRKELEGFVKDLEDLLGSPNVRTQPANRVRFPKPNRTANPHRNPSRSMGGLSDQTSYPPTSSSKEYIDMATHFMLAKGYLLDSRSDTHVTFVKNDEKMDVASWVLLLVLLVSGILPGILYAIYLNTRRVHTTLTVVPDEGDVRLMASGNDRKGKSILEDWIDEPSFD